MSLTEKIKNTASGVASWVNENKKTLGLTTLGLYMGLVGCSKGPSTFEIVPEKVYRAGNVLVVEGYDPKDSTEMTATFPWDSVKYNTSIEEGQQDIQDEITDRDKQALIGENKGKLGNNYFGEPIEFGHNLYR